MDRLDASDVARRRDFFISYSQADLRWAEWIAWQLEEAGYRILLRAWDSVAGSRLQAVIQAGIVESDRTIVVMSPAYLKAVDEQSAWFTAAQDDPLGLERRLVPVRVEECPRVGLLGQLVSVDLVGLDQADARAELLRQIDMLLAGRAKPIAEPSFPGRRPDAPMPRFPGPAVTVAARRQGLAQRNGPIPVRLVRTARIRHVSRTGGAGSVGWVRSVAFSPSGRLLATAGTDGVCRLWDVTDWDRPEPVHATATADQPGSDVSVVAVLTGHVGAVSSVAFSPDGRMLATAGRDGMCRLWDVSKPTSPALGRLLAGHVGAVGSVAFSPDSQVLAAAGYDGAWRLWKLSGPGAPTPSAVVAAHDGEVSALAFSAHGRLLASGGADKAVRVWDVRRPGDVRVVAELDELKRAVGSVAFSPDGRLLAVASHDGTCRIWELAETGRATSAAVLGGHLGGAWVVAFSPDGRLLASGGADRVVRIWDVSESGRPGAPVTVPAGRSGWVSSVAFSPHGRLLATASGRSVELWRLV